MPSQSTDPTTENLAKNPNISPQAIQHAHSIAQELAQARGLHSRQNLPISESSHTRSLAEQIDHTLLKAEATQQDITRVCQEAREYGFATVCVNSSWIPLVASLLKGSKTVPIAVVGFPLGAASTASKAFETREAIREGAREIDMVVHLGALKAQNYAQVIEDIGEVVRAAQPYPVKVILETSLLTQNEKIMACALSVAAGAAFVKTSTGFSTGGATAEDIALMRQVVGPHLGVKASGGIRTRQDALQMIAAGANRLGASSSIAIVSEATTPNSTGSGVNGY